MNVYLLDTPVFIDPPNPVEVIATVDGQTLRVAIEWPAVRRLFQSEHAALLSPVSVADALRGHRRRLALAIEAYLFAHGLPLSNHLVLSERDLQSADAFESVDALPEVAALGHA